MLTVLGTLAATPLTAQTIAGVGGQECSAFTFALGRDSNVAIDAYVAWSQGFISAFNWSNVRQLDLQIDAPAIIHWLAEYCGANPTAPVYRAVQRLIEVNAR